MTLVERLREEANSDSAKFYCYADLLHEAADEIAYLRSEISVLRVKTDLYAKHVYEK